MCSRHIKNKKNVYNKQYDAKDYMFKLYRCSTYNTEKQ